MQSWVLLGTQRAVPCCSLLSICIACMARKYFYKELSLTICLKKKMGENYTTHIHYVNFQSLISIKTSFSAENSKPVLLSEGYFYVKCCNLISSECREAAGIFFKGNTFALSGFILVCFGRQSREFSSLLHKPLSSSLLKNVKTLS